MALVACVLPFQGKSYLTNEKYDEGIAAANAALSESPDDFRAHFYKGRYLLAQDRPEEALQSFTRASELNPYIADYRFWKGVCYWDMKQPEEERQAYLETLELDARHVPALVYLGHNLLDAGKTEQALKRYDEALALDPYEPGALYNRAIALDKLGREEASREALVTYLDAYPDGTMARRAVTLLNAKGDFTYRTHTIGRRQVTMHSIDFKPGTTDFALDVRPSLDFLAAILEEDPNLTIHVVAFNSKDETLAKERAKRIKSYMERLHPKLKTNRLRLSWFGVPEEVKTKSGTVSLDQSVNFITAVETTE